MSEVARALESLMDAAGAATGRAEAAEAKLASIEAHCRKHADWAALHCPDLGRPSEALVYADDILALVDGQEPRERSRSVSPERQVLDRIREILGERDWSES